MKSAAVAEFFSGRVHYAWVVLVVMFFAMLAGADPCCRASSGRCLRGFLKRGFLLGKFVVEWWWDIDAFGRSIMKRHDYR